MPEDIDIQFFFFQVYPHESLKLQKIFTVKMKLLPFQFILIYFPFLILSLSCFLFHPCLSISKKKKKDFISNYFLFSTPFLLLYVSDETPPIFITIKFSFSNTLWTILSTISDSRSAFIWPFLTIFLILLSLSALSPMTIEKLRFCCERKTENYFIVSFV